MLPLDELLGVSPAISALRAQTQQLLARGERARRLPPILLQGETGTGKGLLAGLIHRCGPRSNGPFIDISCAAIPDALLEAELFGFERGAFTDARHAKPGLLHAAHGGTFFLDEVALLEETLQTKLLKVIEEQSVRRLGTTRADSIDIQLISASNEDLAAAMRFGHFRSDLYHRLAVVTLTLPPLRERREDVLPLAEHFLSRTCADYALAPIRRLSPDARRVLQDYHWPGNVRELSNIIESAALMSEGPTIAASMLRLPPDDRTGPSATRNEDEPGSFDTRIRNAEREQLLGALTDTGWNISLAAIKLGISRNRLRYRIEKYALRSTRDLLASKRRYAHNAEPVAEQSELVSPAIARPGSVFRERQYLAILKAEIVSPATVASPTEFTRTLAMSAEKIRTFGGHIQELTATTFSPLLRIAHGIWNCSNTFRSSPQWRSD